MGTNQKQIGRPLTSIGHKERKPRLLELNYRHLKCFPKAFRSKRNPSKLDTTINSERLAVINEIRQIFLILKLNGQSGVVRYELPNGA